MHFINLNCELGFDECIHISNKSKDFQKIECECNYKNHTHIKKINKLFNNFSKIINIYLPPSECNFEKEKKYNCTYNTKYNLSLYQVIYLTIKTANKKMWLFTSNWLLTGFNYDINTHNIYPNIRVQYALHKCNYISFKRNYLDLSRIKTGDYIVDYRNESNIDNNQGESSDIVNSLTSNQIMCYNIHTLINYITHSIVLDEELQNPRDKFIILYNFEPCDAAFSPYFFQNCQLIYKLHKYIVNYNFDDGNRFNNLQLRTHSLNKLSLLHIKKITFTAHFGIKFIEKYINIRKNSNNIVTCIDKKHIIKPNKYEYVTLYQFIDGFYKLLPIKQYPQLYINSDYIHIDIFNTTNTNNIRININIRYD